MKNVIHFALSASIAALCARPHGTQEFRVSAIGQLQAKSGTIADSGGSNAELRNAVAQSDPKVATLAQVAVDALAESALDKVITLSTSNRKVRVLAAAAAADLETLLAGEGVDTLPAGVVVKDDETKSSSTMTATGTNGDLGDAIDAIVGTQKPALSVAALAAKIEDALADIPGIDAIIVIDQPNGELRAYSGSTSAVTATDAAIASGFVEEAVFTQTITVGGSAERPFGE